LSEKQSATTEDIMNDYIAGLLAREHHDMLMADAVAARLARQAGGSRRARSARRPARGSSSATRAFHRPAAAVHSWFAAGNL
jgi:hypothetical protein